MKIIKLLLTRTLAGQVQAQTFLTNRLTLALAAVVLCASLRQEANAGSFHWTGAMTTARYNLMPVLLPNGQVLVEGGVGGSESSSAELYNPATGTWSLTSPMTARRGGSTATLLPNGLVLVAGGWSGSGYLSSAELYNPVTGTWTPANAMTTPRAGHTATLLPNGKVLVAGGTGPALVDGEYALKTAELYDPAAGTWTPTGEMPNKHYMHTATLLPNGMVLVAGGESGATALSSAELYNPATGTWTPTGAMTIARDYHTATLLPNGQVLVAGGHTGYVAAGDRFSSLSSAELYNPATGTWTATTAMRTARTQHTATLLPNGAVLVASGQTGTNYTPIASAELYNPATETWTATGDMNTGRFTHMAILLPNDQVLLAGGWDGLFGSLSSAELYVCEPTPPQPPTNGLVAYYPFNGNANDASGNGSNGATVGSTNTFATDRWNQNSSALVLSNGAFFDCGILLSPSAGNSDYTESCWIQSTQALEISTGTPGYKRIYFMTRRTGFETIGNGTGQGGWGGLCIDNDGLLTLKLDDYFYFYDATVGSAPTNAVVLDGRWHHLLAVHADAVYSLYLDGIRVANFTNTHVMEASDGTRHFWLGSSVYTTSGPGDVALYRGQMDDVRIYNRALSDSEVQQLYTYESTPPPPTITTQPVSQSVNQGSPVSFSVIASGTGLGYQWRLNSTSISGATNASYSLASATTNDTGIYTVIVSNAGGSVTSSNAILAVIPANPPPGFLTNGLLAYYPFNGNANDATGHGNTGITTNITFAADRFGKSSSAIRFSGESFVDLGKAIFPASPAAYTECCWIKSTQVLEPRPYDPGYTKHIVFMTRRTGSSDVATGGWATLDINVSGRLSLNVDDYYYGNLTCSTSSNVLDGAWHSIVGVKNGTNYALYLDGKLVASIVDNHVMSAGDGNRSFWLGKHFWQYADPTGTAYYQGDMDEVRLYNRALSDSEVQQMYAYESTPPPTITTQPVSQSVHEGSPVSFSVIATGTGLGYQWQWNSTSISGATNASYSLASATTNDTGIYTVIVSNAGGSVTSSNAILAVIPANPPPGFLTNGLLAYYPFNGNANDATGNGNTGITTNITFAADRFGKSSSAIRFSGESFVDLGKAIFPASPAVYTECCWIKSTQVLEPRPYDPGYTKQIVFMTRSTGSSDVARGGWATMDISTSGRLTLAVDDYYYGNGTCSTSTNVLNGAWHSIVGVKNGTNYALYLDGKLVASIVDNHVMSASDGNRSFWLGKHFWHYLDPAGTAYYQGDMDEVRLYNRALSDSEVQQLYAYESTPPPNITTQPVSQSVNQGSPVSFSVIATGTGLGYHWQWNSVNIPGATNASYSLASATANNAGIYTVIVSNAEGSVTSSNAVLTVIPPFSTATGTATLFGIFVVGANITDGGSGYTNIPVVRFVGGGGSGAQAVAVVSNGVVTALSMLDAGYGYTNAPLVVIDPPFIGHPVLGIAPMSFLSFTNLTVGGSYQLQRSMGWYWANEPVSFTATGDSYTQMVAGVAVSGDYRLALNPVPAQAFATAQLFNGFVVGAAVTSGGSGYVTSPAVNIVGGGGTNATALSHISGGVVTAISITDAGIGYTNAPTIQIAAPPAAAVSPTVLPVMRVDAGSLAPYNNYQIQFKPGLGEAWGNWNGGLFTPTDGMNSQYLFITNGAGFFRLQHAP